MGIYAQRKYYDLRLSLDCNLDKNLRKEWERYQLVKCKKYRAVSILYIRISYEESIDST